MKKLVEELSWDEFYFRYTEYHEEFCFWYKEYKINLCWGNNGTFAYNIVINKKILLVYEEFSTPYELLEKARFDNLTLKEIYNELY